MAIKGFFVTNIGQNATKYRAQAEEFLSKSRLIANLELVELKNQEVLKYLEKNTPDFCLFWDKDIYLARTIEGRGIKVFNNPEAIYLCDDKALTAYALDLAKISQPKYYVLPLHFYGNIIEHYDLYKKHLLVLGFPLVIKERFGSFGEQVYLAKNEEELIKIIEEHGTKGLIAQQFIAHQSGTDYRLNVLGEEVLVAIKRHNPHDFRSNINQGGTFTLFDASAKMKEVAIAATKAVKGYFAGVDIMLLEDGTPQVIEVNSNMRTVAVNKVSDKDLTLEILKYIVKSL